MFVCVCVCSKGGQNTVRVWLGRDVMVWTESQMDTADIQTNVDSQAQSYKVRRTWSKLNSEIDFL